MNPAHPSILRYDARKPLPFGTGEFDAVYHSHVLEHLTRTGAAYLINECKRILKTGGILRVVVPDLERIVREYLKWLNLVGEGCPCAEPNYDWIMLELYDQVTRSSAGGEMLAYFRSGTVTNLNYIRERCGDEFYALERISDVGSPTEGVRPRGPTQGIKAALRSLRERCGRFLLRVDQAVLDEARFRLCGESHRWMYDRFSLKRCLDRSSFEDIRIVSATESRIVGWAGYSLDADGSGRSYKPDSIYLEGRRP